MIAWGRYAGIMHYDSTARTVCVLKEEEE